MVLPQNHTAMVATKTLLAQNNKLLVGAFEIRTCWAIHNTYMYMCMLASVYMTNKADMQLHVQITHVHVCILSRLQKNRLLNGAPIPVHRPFNSRSFFWAC